MSYRISSFLRPVITGQGPLRSCSSLSTSPVRLSFDKYDLKPDSASTAPVLILHGLFGSRQNWRGISKRLNSDLIPNRPVYAIDARNHGLSPRHPEHNYDLLAEDLKALYGQLGISKAALLGHSMGGRVMMNFALKYPELIDKLIVVDITQFNMAHNSDQIMDMLKILQQLKLDNTLTAIAARKSISETLTKIGVNQATRDFVLINLTKNSENEFEWRINIESLMRNIQNVLEFPQQNLINAKFLGETLYIGGCDSKYIQKKDIERIRTNFPKAEFEFIEKAGHLVHVEQPAKFIQVVTKFLNAN